MRNAVQRRNHKERAQPLEREKWGVLEKHKVSISIKLLDGTLMLTLAGLLLAGQRL